MKKPPLICGKGDLLRLFRFDRTAQLRVSEQAYGGKLIVKVKVRNEAVLELPGRAQQLRR